MKSLSKVYCFFAGLHRKLYEIGYFKPVKIGKRVLSVGNLTMGGTGKTPIVRTIVQDLKNLNLRTGIVVRNYQATSRSATRLTDDLARHPDLYGDEACWYFQNLKIPVFTGPHKWRSAKLADSASDVDIVVVDDGFQHHELFKDFNIVLLDAVAGIKGLEERSRESASALKHATAIVISRSNQGQKESVNQLKKLVPSGIPTFLNETVFKNLRSLNGISYTLETEKILLASGIANPDSFEKAFSDRFERAHIQRMDFPDHHAYQQADLKKIEMALIENKLDFVVITEKDEIKMKEVLRDSDQSLRQTLTARLLVLEIESRFTDAESWNRFLRGLLK